MADDVKIRSKSDWFDYGGKLIKLFINLEKIV